MKNGRVFIDRFDCGLTDLPRAAQRDQQAVLRHIIGSGGRFSCFEAGDNPSIAKTITALCRSIKGGELQGFIEFDESRGYPWTALRLTDAGRIMLPDLAKLTAPLSPTGGENG
jgi:hypothetical protein